MPEWLTQHENIAIAVLATMDGLLILAVVALFRHNAKREREWLRLWMERENKHQEKSDEAASRLAGNIRDLHTYLRAMSDRMP